MGGAGLWNRPHGRLWKVLVEADTTVAKPRFSLRQLIAWPTPRRTQVNQRVRVFAKRGPLVQVDPSVQSFYLIAYEQWGKQ